MTHKKRAFYLCTLFTAAVFFTICYTSSDVKSIFSSKETVSIVSYNTQTFFDAVEDGCEFKQFRGTNTKWSKEKYSTRLKRLFEAVKLSCKVLENIDGTPDILILQEIENRTVIEDFCKLLSVKDSYNEAVFIPPEKGGAFGTAVLSKFHIKNIKIHKLNYKALKLRPLGETVISFDLKGGRYEMVFFNVHWKSKLGKESGIPVRKKQEKLLFKKIKDIQNQLPESFIIACGDFNQTPSEFSEMKEFKNCWDFNKETEEAENLTDYSQYGSYFFKKEWEQIDHFFYSGNLKDSVGLEISKFAVIAEEPLIKKDGTPNRYLLHTGQGYSDHLPVGIVLSVK